MIKNSNGFSLVELMISMALLLLSLAAASTIFSNILIPFKQQTKISETNIEGIVGLDLLRRDLEHAGIGLPWNIPSGTTYTEASSTTICGTANPSTYNDSTSNPPRAVISGNNNCTNNSDYFVIKSANIARNYAAGKNTTLSTGNVKRTWDPDRENVNKDDSGTTNNNVRIIIISPGSTTANSRALVVAPGAFFTTYSNTSAFAPSDNTDTRLIYGIDPDTDLTMPFSRADYYISTSNVPSKCATGTGVLTKGIINQSDGNISNPLPLLDCVADMQVIYQLDMNDDGAIGTQSNANGSSVSGSEGASAANVQGTLNDASLLRQRLKEVRIYLLTHEGQMDLSYAYPNSTVTVGDYGLGSTFNLSSTIGSTYINYRWKVYTIVVKPGNLGV